MFKSSTVTVTSAHKTTPILLFTVFGASSAPAAVDVYNSSGTHKILIGGSTKATCLRPLPGGTSFQFSIIGSSSLYARLTGTTTVQVIVTVGP